MAAMLWSASGTTEPGNAWKTWIISGHTVSETSTPAPRSRSASRSESSISTSLSPTSMRIGGRPSRSVGEQR